MFNCYKNYSNKMPKITIYANCDTALTLNLGCFSFAPQEQLIFVIKNHDYTEAPVEFLHKVEVEKINEDKNYSFVVPKEAAAAIKTGAIYTFMFKHTNGRCSKVTPNGFIRVEYGADGLIIKEDVVNE
jgi:hypothetical protein